MKYLVKEIILIVLAVICVGFFISNILGVNEEGTLQVLGNMSSIVDQMKDTEVINNAAGAVGTQVSGTVPAITYSEGAQYKGSEICFKEMFEVTLASGTWPGDSENGFAIYLKDIQDSAGNSRLISLDSESIDSMDEIVSDFVYDAEQDVLHIYGSGVYFVHLKIYTDDGLSAVYSFALPVEEREDT